jgi:hypothetical protein
VKNLLGIIGGAAVGAGVLYLVDPNAGKRRRAILRDGIIHLRKVLTRSASIASRDTSNRMKGIVEEARKLVNREEVDDAKLLDRVRAAVGRASSHPNVEVIVSDGWITLLGPVVDHEERGVLRAAKSVRGVQGLTNRMKAYRRLQTEETEHSQPGHWFDVMHAHGLRRRAFWSVDSGRLPRSEVSPLAVPAAQ